MLINLEELNQELKYSDSNRKYAVPHPRKYLLSVITSSTKPAPSAPIVPYCHSTKYLEADKHAAFAAAGAASADVATHKGYTSKLFPNFPYSSLPNMSY